MSNGVVLWEGKGFGGRGRAVAIATGTVRPSMNRKVGWSVQVWILDANRNPVEAVSSGKDYAICGDCPLRKGRGCYVNVGQAPLSIWKAYKKKAYPDWGCNALPFRAKFVRWGAYGEPVLVPRSIVARVNAVAAGWSGYTHAWSRPEYQEYRDYFMASVDSEEGLRRARALGWRTYRIVHSWEERRGDEFSCPASKEAGYRLTCAACKACGGGAWSGQATPVIVAHGSKAGRIWEGWRVKTPLPLVS